MTGTRAAAPPARSIDEDERRAVGRDVEVDDGERHARHLPRAALQARPVDLGLLRRAGSARRAAPAPPSPRRRLAARPARPRLGALFGLVRVALLPFERDGVELRRRRAAAVARSCFVADEVELACRRPRSAGSASLNESKVTFFSSPPAAGIR